MTPGRTLWVIVQYGIELDKGKREKKMSIMHNPKTAAFNAAIADMAAELNCDPDALATEAIAIQRDYHYSNSDMGMGEGVGYGPDDSAGPRNSAWNSIRAELNDPRIRAGKAILGNRHGI